MFKFRSAEILLFKRSLAILRRFSRKEKKPTSDGKVDENDVTKLTGESISYKNIEEKWRRDLDEAWAKLTKREDNKMKMKEDLEKLRAGSQDLRKDLASLKKTFVEVSTQKKEEGKEYPLAGAFEKKQQVKDKKIPEPSRTEPETKANPFIEDPGIYDLPPSSRKIDDLLRDTPRKHKDWDTFQEHLFLKKLTTEDFSKLWTALSKESQYEKYDQTPHAAQVFCVCALTPIAAISLLSLVQGAIHPGLLQSQLVLSATLLSFFGGVNLGSILASESFDFRSFQWVVGPPALGWVSTLLPLPMGYAFCCLGLSLSLIHDVLLSSHPQWFKTVRFVFTVGAVGSLLVMFLFTLL